MRLNRSIILFFACFITFQGIAQPGAKWEVMKYGLFVHFVYGGEYGGMTNINKDGGIPANIDLFAEAFDVNKFANDVQSMGFEYVIFTAWHANMGVLYPSKVMADYGFDQKDHYTSKRDLLGDVIDALAKKGIETSIYTHIFVGHDFHPEGSGYFSYDNKQGTITQDMINSGYVDAVNGNSTKWNDFTNKVYDEMSARYGEKVSSYWFDGTWVPNSWVDKNRMMQTIRKNNKTCAFVANGDAVGHGMPYGAKEVGWGGPEDKSLGFISDYPPVSNNDVTSWPSYKSSIAMIQGGNWWATKGGRRRYSAETIYKYSVFQASTSTSGGMSWAFSPYVDGSWEVDNLAEMQKAYSYLKPVEESIKKTRPSTSFPTKQGTKINTMPYSFVATKSVNDSIEYLHVLKPPVGNAIELPYASDGKFFDRAELLPSKKQVALNRTKSGYSLTLPAGENWNPLNTVIKLFVEKTNHRINVTLDKPVTASSSCFSNVPTNVTSSKSNSSSIWSSCLKGNEGYQGENVHQWIQIDLGNSYRSYSLISWKLTSASDGDASISDFVMQLSDDGVNWKGVDTVVNNRSKVYSKPLDYLPATRYVRVYISKASNNWDPRIKMEHIDVFGIKTARFFRNTNYAGESAILFPGSYTRSQLELMGIINNDISSFYVPEGYEIQVFDGENFTQELGRFTSDQMDLVPLNMNDKISSLKILPSSVVTDLDDHNYTNETLSPSLYPNPNQGSFKVILPHGISSRVEIFNGLGHSVYQGNHVGNADLQLLSLSKGVYILKIKSGEVVSEQKMVIE